MNKKITIATHDGVFHSDDCFAVATLLTMLDAVPVVPDIVRTRDETLIRKADFVVDVGGVCDSEKNRFDHHQEGGAGKRANGISYASFGLVWHKFGKDIAGSGAVAALVDKNLVTPIDADDTGMDLYRKIFPGTVPYLVNDCIHNLRPTWQESTDETDARFMEAVAFGKKVLEREVAHAKAFVEAEGLVKAIYEKTLDKRLIILDVFYPHEETLASFPEPLFAVSPRLNGTWHAKTIRDDMSSFKNRKSFPVAWAGKRDAELARLTGVPDAVFCHTGLFMAVARTKEGAIALAKLALK